MQLLDRHLALRGGGLVGDTDEQVTGLRQAAGGRGGAGDQAHVLHAQRRLRETAAGICDELVEHTVAIEESGGPHGFSAATSDSQCPCWTASAGCDTSACQTTAWKDSTSGVRRDCGGSSVMAMSASSASVPPGAPTTP